MRWYALTNKWQDKLDPNDPNVSWAWLNVNTRCLYHQLKPPKSHPDNISLCPLLDTANHSFLPHVFRPTDNNKGSLSFISPPDRPIEPNEELFLKYGNHANRTLFAEYGFVVENHPFPEVDTQDILEPMLLSHRDTLEREGYWGRWTMHLNPAPAHPSYRLLTALRLYHSPNEKDWVAMIRGERENISQKNEMACRQFLACLCEQIIKRCDCRREKGTREGELLWAEERETAMGVLESIHKGEEF